MNISASPAVKVAILILFAILFAGSLVSLSVSVDGTRHGAYWSDRDHRSHGGDRTDRRLSEAFAVSPGGSLRLETDLGDVRITGGAADSVLVTVSIRGDEHDVEDFDVRFDGTEGGVDIRGRHRDGGHWRFDWDDFRVRYEISVPSKFNVRVVTSGGDVVVSDITGTITGESSGGDITFSTITGDVRMETSGGTVKMANITGTVVTETSGGDIEGRNIDGDVRAGTSGGDIDLRDVRGRTVANTSGGDVNVEVVEYRGISVSTSGGDIVLRLPQSAKADIRAEAASGDVRCDFPFLGSLDDGSLDGTINGGGASLRAETSGGDISIRRRP